VKTKDDGLVKDRLVKEGKVGKAEIEKKRD
jgi:hypothetical protein